MNPQRVGETVRSFGKNIYYSVILSTLSHYPVGLYGHPTTVLHPVIRNVPWVRTTAIDEGTHEPEMDPIEDERQSVDDNLAALGYL